MGDRISRGSWWKIISGRSWWTINPNWEAAASQLGDRILVNVSSLAPSHHVSQSVSQFHDFDVTVRGWEVEKRLRPTLRHCPRSALGRSKPTGRREAETRCRPTLAARAAARAVVRMAVGVLSAAAVAYDAARRSPRSPQSAGRTPRTISSLRAAETASRRAPHLLHAAKQPPPLSVPL